MRILALAFAAAVAAAILGASPHPARADYPVQITIIGVDGKPVALPGGVGRASSGEKIVFVISTGEGFPPSGLYQDANSTPTATGSVVTFFGTDAAGNYGATTAFIPASGQTEVTITLHPPVRFDDGYRTAKAGKETGNTAEYDKGIAEAEEAQARGEAGLQEAQQAVNSWAIANNMPVMTLKQIKKRIERAENLPPGETEPINLGNLKIYQSKLEGLKSWRQQLEWQKDHLADLKGPTQGAFFRPGGCTEGTMLAGLCGERGGDSFGDREQEQEPEQEQENELH